MTSEGIIAARESQLMDVILFWNDTQEDLEFARQFECYGAEPEEQENVIWYGFVDHRHEQQIREWIALRIVDGRLNGAIIK